MWPTLLETVNAYLTTVDGTEAPCHSGPTPVALQRAISLQGTLASNPYTLVEPPPLCPTTNLGGLLLGLDLLLLLVLSRHLLLHIKIHIILVIPRIQLLLLHNGQASPLAGLPATSPLYLEHLEDSALAKPSRARPAAQLWQVLESVIVATPDAASLSLLQAGIAAHSSVATSIGPRLHHSTGLCITSPVTLPSNSTGAATNDPLLLSNSRGPHHDRTHHHRQN